MSVCVLVNWTILVLVILAILVAVAEFPVVSWFNVGNVLVALVKFLFVKLWECNAKTKVSLAVNTGRFISRLAEILEDVISYLLILLLSNILGFSNDLNFKVWLWFSKQKVSLSVKFGSKIFLFAVSSETVKLYVWLLLVSCIFGVVKIILVAIPFKISLVSVLLPIVIIELNTFNILNTPSACLDIFGKTKLAFVNVLFVNVWVAFNKQKVSVPVGSVKSLIVLPKVNFPVISAVPFTNNFLLFELVAVPNKKLSVVFNADISFPDFWKKLVSVAVLAILILPDVFVIAIPVPAVRLFTL